MGSDVVGGLEVGGWGLRGWGSRGCGLRRRKGPDGWGLLGCLNSYVNLTTILIFVPTNIVSFGFYLLQFLQCGNFPSTKKKNVIHNFPNLNDY